MTPGPHVGPAHILASTFPPERRADPLDELIPVGGDSEKILRFDTLWEAENFVLNKTKGGELLVRVYCETGDTRTAKIESFFSGLFSCGGAPTESSIFGMPNQQAPSGSFLIGLGSCGRGCLRAGVLLGGDRPAS